MPEPNNPSVEEEEMTFSELYSTLILNSELIVTIHDSEVDKLKTGLKNAKNRITSQQKEEGIPVEDMNLSFMATESLSYPGYIRLRCLLSKKGAFKYKALEIPEGLPI